MPYGKTLVDTIESSGNLSVTGNVTTSGTITSSTGTTYPLVSGTSQTTTSGTFKDFENIPSWVKRITVVFSGVSTNGTSGVIVQIGDGSINATGYSAASSSGATTVTSVAYTTGFGIRVASASNQVHGSMTIYNFTGNTWVASHSLGDPIAPAFFLGGGSKTLSSALDRVRITTVNGTDTFDAGSINILYE